jgi:hypothetical protein
MKVFKIKLIRYSTAAGALLAVSGAANAVVVPGTIMLNYSGNLDPAYNGDAILDHDNDIVYIDMNNDGIPDFIAYMWIDDDSSSGAMFFSSYGSGSSNGFFAMDSSYTLSVNKFDLNDQIGPSFSDYNNWGLLGGFSGSDGPPPPSPLGDYFDWDGDHGYIGIGLGTPGSANFGWVEMDLRTNSQSAEFLACALETVPNTPITAGNSAVPLLPIASAAGMGLIGLMAALKRRKKTTV